MDSKVASQNRIPSHNKIPSKANLDEQEKRREEDEKKEEIDEKSTPQYYINESKRLIRAGFHKKAFNLLEPFYRENKDATAIQRIQMLRRIMLCLTKICKKYVSKGEIVRLEHVYKLYDKSIVYLQHWHDLISMYVIKTNPKFAHLQGFLDDLTNTSADDDVDILNISRRGSNISGGGSKERVSPTGGGSRSSLFVNMIKPNSGTPNNKENDLENTFNVFEGSRIIHEEFVGNELNIPFILDEFFKYYLMTTMNWGLFMKKLQRFSAAYKFFFTCLKVSQELESSLNPDLLQVCTKTRLKLAVFFSEFGKQQESLDTLESIINLCQVEISLRINRHKDKNTEGGFFRKMKAAVRNLVLTFLNMSIIFEQQEKYSRIVETLKLAFWFCSKYLTADEEIYQSTMRLYTEAMNRYSKYLSDVAEIERVISGNHKDYTSDTGYKGKVDHFTKINERLYNLFQYDNLNKSQYIIVNHTPSRIQSASLLKRPMKHEFSQELRDDMNDRSSDGSLMRASMSPTKKDDIYAASYLDLEGAGDATRKMGHSRTSKNVGFAGAASTVSIGVKERKTKKGSRKIFDLGPGYEPKLITSSKYFENVEPEKEIENIELNEKEEEDYMMMLNRNIKNEIKLHKTKGNKDFVDLEDYFTKIIEQKIDDQTTKRKPIKFDRIVKNYAYFLHEEDFDEKEFEFTRKMLNQKHKEGLGEQSIKTKYVAPIPKFTERSNVIREGKNLESKYWADQALKHKEEAKKQYKNAQAKEMQNFKEKERAKLLAKERKSVTKPGTLIKIEENTTEEKKKPSLGNILMKHATKFGLDRIKNLPDDEKQKKTEYFDRENKKKEMTLASIKDEQMNTSPHETLNTQVFETQNTQRDGMGMGARDPKDLKKYAQTTKDMIQLMMENIERNIKNSDDVQDRLRLNKPLVVQQKKKEAFLKVGDELAKSTYALSVERNTKMKTMGSMGFADLVLTSKKLNDKQQLKAKMAKAKKRQSFKDVSSPKSDPNFLNV